MDCGFEYIRVLVGCCARAGALYSTVMRYKGDLDYEPRALAKIAVPRDSTRLYVYLLSRCTPRLLDVYDSRVLF